MGGKILVIGGYGNVGRLIAIELADRFPGQVIAAGRNYRKSQELAQATGMKILPMELDVFCIGENYTLPDDIRIVVMCLDLPDAVFVKYCLQRGIHYVDISASYELLSQIELLDADAKKHNATALLSVGLAPGLTNLLAAHCKSRFEWMERADIFVLLGLGEAHGEAAIRWTIENLNSNFSIRENGVVRHVASFSEGKRTIFPRGIGTRTAYSFNFSDQHVIPKTLEIPSASTWICFDTALMTNLLALYRKIGLLNALRYKPLQELMVKIFKTLHFGSDIFIMKVDAHGMAGGKDTFYECAVTGHGEGRGTALIASEVAAGLYSAPFPPGVFHIEQLFDPAQMIANLEGKGITFYSS
jgi:saccharopine dehydrogenase (NAD+, L-lysine-forming)